MTNTEGGTDDEEFRVAAVKDRAEVTAQVWMGLTLGAPSVTRTSSIRSATTSTTLSSRSSIRLRTPTSPTTSRGSRLRRESRKRKRARSRARSPRSRLELETRAQDLGAERTAWERELGEQRNAWFPLLPLSVSARSGATARVLEDRSVLVEGGAATDVLTLRFDVGAVDLTAMRLEALSHADLPHGGPGRSPDNGNFRPERARGAHGAR
jgi:hypothetical protein